jgi:hypothetical protein
MLMPTTIVANDIPISMYPGVYEEAVREALHHVADGCQVYIVKLDGAFGVEVRIVRPRGNSWSREFLGLEAQPEYIRRTIKETCLIDTTQRRHD